MVVEIPRVILTAHDGTPLGDLDPTRLAGLRVISEVNGEHYMEVTTTQALAKGDRLLWRDGMGYWHEFVVESDEATHDATGAPVHLYWCPWSVQHDLAATFVTGMPGTGGTPATAAEALAAALAGTARWAVGTVGISTTGSASFWRMSGWEALQELVGVWGGEVRATITVSPTTGVTGRTVDLLEHVGKSDATRRFDYGHDAIGINRLVEDQQWTARVMPLGAAEQTDDGGYGRKITIESVNGGSATLENASAVPLTRVPDGSGGWEVPVQVVENGECETPADLLAWATAHLDEWTTPKVSYEASVAQLSQAGLDATGVAEGDEVAVVDATFCDGGLRIEGRALRIEEDLLDPTQTVITVSNLRGTLADQFDGIAQATAEVRGMVEGMSAAQSSTEWVQNLLARINADINATGGYTYITEGQGIRTYDVAVTDPLVGAEASAVCEIKGGTMRIANTKDSSGNWEWKTVFTSGRILAELIDAIGTSSGVHAQLTATGLDVYDGSTRVAHFGEQTIIGRFQNGQALDKYLTVDYDALEFHDLGGTVMRVSGSTANSLLSMASDMLRLYTTQIIGSSGLVDGLYAYLTNGFEFGSGGMEATDSGAHMTEIIAGRHWASDASKNDMAELWLFTTDGGVNPFAALQVESGSNSIDFRLNATGSGTGMELDGEQVYPTHGSLAQDTNVASGGSVTRTISFGHTYASAPTFVPSLYSTSSDAGIGNLSIVTTEVTTTGAKVKIFNNDSQTRAPGVRWIALG